jgi:hypothetical protein
MNKPLPGTFQKVRKVAGIVAATVLVLMGVGWLFAEKNVFSGYRQRLFESPVTSIRSIRMSPGNVSPLSNRVIVITNSITISQIMAGIRSANTYFPNHPVTQWSSDLKISGSSGESYVTVIESPGQGTILYCETGVGLIFETLQSHEMGTILERVATQNNR